MSDVPLLKKVNNEEFYPEFIYKEDVVDALRKFQDILKSQIKIHNKQLEFEGNELQRSYVCGEIESYIKTLEISNKVFGVLDSQNNLNEVKKL